jgi:hypothetical protein
LIRSLPYRESYKKISSGEILKNNSEHSEFTKDYFSVFVDVLKSDKHANIILNIQYGLFIDKLISFICMPKVINMNLEHLSNHLNANKDLVKTFTEKYTLVSNEEGRTKYIKTPELILKAFYDCVILALYLHNYKMDMDPLCKSIKVDQKLMLSRLKVFNCTFPQIKKEVNSEGKKVKKINMFSVELKAPLKLNIEPNKLRNNSK